MIPKELNDFFEVNGRILLIKGHAGTGKTLLGLRLLNNLRSHGDILWINSRDIRPTDITGLDDIVPKESRINATQYKVTGYSKGPEAIDLGKQMAYHSDFELIGAIYSEILASEKPTVVIDSYDGIITNFSKEKKEAFGVELTELARHTKTNMIIIQESDAMDVFDYLVDGYVVLSSKEIDGRRVREMLIGKLRGVEITNPKYIFTLNGGSYLHFEPYKSQISRKDTSLHQKIPNRNNKYSTGSRDLDVILDGGYPAGSFVLLEVGDNILPEAHIEFIVSTISNFIANDLAVSIIPSGGMNIKSLYSHIVPFVGEEKFNRMVRINTRSGVEEKYTSQYMGKVYEEDYKNWYETLYNLKKTVGENKTSLQYVGYDTLETCYGDVSKGISEHVEFSKDIGDVLIGQIKPGLRISQDLINMSDIHLKLKEMDGTVLLYGEKPRTPLYEMRIVYDRGSPEVKLTLVV